MIDLIIHYVKARVSIGLRNSWAPPHPPHAPRPTLDRPALRDRVPILCLKVRMSQNKLE